MGEGRVITLSSHLRPASARHLAGCEASVRRVRWVWVSWGWAWQRRTFVLLNQLELKRVIIRRKEGRVAMEQLVDHRTERPAVDARAVLDDQPGPLLVVSQVGRELRRAGSTNTSG